MYIGPWQEYKLARLIQNQQRQINSLRSGLHGLPSTPGHTPGSVSSRRRGYAQSETGADDARSEGHSTAGFSTKSAPVRQSAQMQLDEYYNENEREARRQDRGRMLPPPRPPRQRIGSAAKAKALAKKKSQPSLHEVRKSHMENMRKLYGLAGSRPESPAAGAAEQPPIRANHPSAASASDGPSPSSAASAVLRERPAILSSEPSGHTSLQPPAWLAGVQSHAGPQSSVEATSIGSRSTAATSSAPVTVQPWQGAGYGRIAPGPSSYPQKTTPSLEPPTSTRRLCPALEQAFDELRTSMGSMNIPEMNEDFPDSPCDKQDPLGLSSMSIGSAKSNDLIAWSKNLQPDALSPEATLASFFKI